MAEGEPRSPVLPVTALILGGGGGRRLGEKKLFLRPGGRWLLPRVLARVVPWVGEVLLVVAPEDRGALERLLREESCPVPLRVTEDVHPRRGPLEGLASGLEHLRTPWAFALGCDMPFVREATVRCLWERRTSRSQVVCGERGGYLEPLHAFYAVSCLPAARRALEAGRRGMKDFYGQVCLTVVEEAALGLDPEHGDSFAGINTPEDLVRYLSSSRDL